MTAPSIFLSATDTIVLSLAKPRVVTGSMRKDRLTATTLKLEKNKPVDLCKFLNCSREEAWAVLADSPDVQTLQKKRLLRVIDKVDGPDSEVVAEERDKALAAIKAKEQQRAFEQAIKATELKHAIEQAIQGALPPKPDHFASVIAALDERREKEIEERHNAEPKLPATAVAGTFKIETVIEEDGADAIEATPKVDIESSVPSTKWDLKQLQAYANERGMKVEGLSKNALLKKLRGHG